MSALQELLNLGLVDIGSDDSRFEKMKFASSAFASKLEEEPGTLIQATLIAIDEEVEEDDLILVMIEEMVLEVWPTMRNTHNHRPRVLLRSIIIDALTAAIEKNHEAAGIVWNTASSPYRHKQIQLGKSKSIVEGLLQKSMQNSETEAIRRASLATSSKKRKRNKKFTPEPVSLDVEETVTYEDLITDVESACTSTSNGRTVQGANPYTIAHGENWLQEFTPRMTKALVKSVNLGTKLLAESLSKSLSSYFDTFEQRIATLVTQAEQFNIEISESYDSSRMRLDVLWWSEALYSPSHYCSYREMNLSVAAVAAATDLTAELSH
jgi:hypothetical protein